MADQIISITPTSSPSPGATTEQPAVSTPEATAGPTVEGAKIDRKARDIVGLPVVTFNSGNKVYDVEDMIVDPARPQVLALLVQEKALFHSARVIPFGYIKAIGPDAVIIPDGKAVVELDRLKDKQLRGLYNDQVVRGLRVLSDDGRKLGTISDMLIDVRTGEIKGYYMSIGGRVLDVTQGTRFIPAFNVINMGQRVLYISAQTANELESQTGGWSGALDSVGSNLRTSGSKANTALLTMGDKAKVSGQQWNESLGRYGDQLRNDLPNRAGAAAVGKQAHQTVTAPDGTIIVREGDVISQDQADAARDTGRLPQLLLAAGVGPTRQHVDNFSNQAADSWEQTRQEFRDLWARLTGGYAENLDRTDERFMERRVKNALGRPADRVILDADDNVILNTGDIITNRAIEEARAAGVLDILVDSAYKAKPDLSTQDLKASHSGQASLENIEANPGSRTRALPPGKTAGNSETKSISPTAGGDAQTGTTTIVPPSAG